MTSTDQSDTGGGAEQPHKRRVRYSGKAPKSFHERYKERDPNAHPDVYKKLRAKGKTPAGAHVSVLPNEVIAWLKPDAGEIVADCTLGFGGHAVRLLAHIGPRGLLVGFDVDGKELERTRHRLVAAGAVDVDAASATAPTEQPATAPEPMGRIKLLHRNFAGIGAVPAELGIEGFDIIFADLGVSSMQIDDPSRGISYKAEGPLDMRLDTRLKRTGADVLATISRDELSQALWDYADEPDHERIAQWVVNQRKAQPITTIGQLSRLIFTAKGTTETAWRKQAAFKQLHPAARTFQALRILVNDELGALRELLRVAPYCLRPGGRIGIISFHSGEDRLVKVSFRENHQVGVYDQINEDVIRPTQEEVRANSRSSSAKFRWARRAK